MAQLGWRVHSPQRFFCFWPAGCSLDFIIGWRVRSPQRFQLFGAWGRHGCYFSCIARQLHRASARYFAARALNFCFYIQPAPLISRTSAPHLPRCQKICCRNRSPHGQCRTLKSKNPLRAAPLIYIAASANFKVYLLLLAFNTSAG